MLWEILEIIVHLVLSKFTQSYFYTFIFYILHLKISLCNKTYSKNVSAVV